MRYRLVALVPVLVAALAACGGQGATATSPTSAPASETEDTDAAAEDSAGELGPAEGPAADGPYTWPDGITAAIISIETAPAVEPDDPAEDTEVRVTVEFGNEGTDTLSFGDNPNMVDAGPVVDLLYGANRTRAHGWYYDDNNLPTQLTPGTSAQWTALFTMPGSELGELAVTVAPDDTHAPWIFTEAETLVG